MKRFLKIIGATLILFVAGVGIYKLAYPTYSWNQKLTLVVETPEGVKTGSAVSEVTHWFHPNIPVDAGIRKDSLRGEAVVVDLGGGQYLFALLRGGPSLKAAFGDRLPELSYSKDWLKRYFRAVERMRGGSAPVPFEALPTLVTFADTEDPASVTLVDPEDLAASFGEGYTLREAVLEITRERVTEGQVEEVLGWLYDIWPNHLDGQRFSNFEATLPFANSLSANSFSTEISK